MNNDEQAWKGVIDRYYTPEQQAEWQASMEGFEARSGFDQNAYQAQWRELGDRVAAALPLDPASDAALALVREWFALLEPFTRVATPQMWNGTAAMYQDMKSWEGQADPGFSADVWAFIRDATAAHRELGHDVGPLPSWMTAQG